MKVFIALLFVSCFVGTALAGLKLKMQQAELAGDTESLYYYYVDILVGTHHQTQSLIVDTGSHLTGFPCDPFCRSCGNHSHSHFNQTASTSSRVLTCAQEQASQRRCACQDDQCTYTASYMEGSRYQGIFVRDEVCFGDEWVASQAIPFKFGCHNVETKLFFTQEADGIMGLGKPVPSEVDSLPTALFKAAKVENDMFALCLGHDGGHFTIGNFDDSLHLDGAQPLFLNYQGGSLFTLPLHTIVLWGTSIDISGSYSNAVVDSGTTLVQMPGALYDKLASAFSDFCDSSESFCKGKKEEMSNHKICYRRPVQLTQVEFFSTFPPLFFMIEDQAIEWLPSEYFYQWRGFECLGINRGGGQTILGATFMRQKNVIFDLENEQIALVAANCSADPNRVRIDKNVTTNATLSHVYVNSNDTAVQVGKHPTPFTYPTIHGAGSSDDLTLFAKITLFALVVLVFVLLICVCKYCCRESQDPKPESLEEEEDETESKSESSHSQKVSEFVEKVRKEDEAIEKQKKYRKVDQL